ncbi:MAG: hypothetical protein AAF840_13285 [Bacteroidota bacterium]
MFFCLLLLFSFTSLQAQHEDAGTAWRKGEYEKLLTTHPKLFVFPNGEYLITTKLPKEIKEVAFSVLFFHKEIGKVQPKGRLSEKFVSTYLRDLKPFNPLPVMARPPCCPIYDKKGRLVGSVYPPNGCPSNCRKPFSKGGKIYQMDCCLPQSMNWQLLTNLQVQLLP